MKKQISNMDVDYGAPRSIAARHQEKDTIQAYEK
jgi:hypothetical protein